MNTLIPKTLLLLALAAAGTAAADERHDLRGYEGRGHESAGALQWRLGDSRGSGREVLYRAPGDRRWRTAPGAATDLADGWVLGVDRHRGGYGIYQWNGRGWSRMPGAAVYIGGSYRQPWVINDRGERFVWTGYDWRETRAARDDRRDRDDWRRGRGRDGRGDDDREDRDERRFR